MVTNRQSGQAMLELTAILVGVVAMLVGFLFIAGMSLADNRTLLRAKANAEAGARGDGEVEEFSGEVLGWSYGRTTIGRDEITIPFSSRDTILRELDANLLRSTRGSLSSERHSGGSYRYRWMNPAEFDSGLGADFSPTLSTAYDAARLYRGSDSSVGPIFEFDRTGRWEDGSYDNSEATRRRTGEAMRETFYDWFGVRISERQLTDSPANQVYMPISSSADQE